MQVVYKKMTRDRAKSNVAKWNLMGGMQFKHVKNCLMFMQCNDCVCSDWTLDVVLMVRDETTVSCLACAMRVKERKNMF